MHLPELVTGSSLLLLTTTNAPIKPWISRKILHIGIGTLLLNADISDPNVVNGIYSSCFLSGAVITNKGLNKVSDDRKNNGFIKDIGIFGYIVACYMCLLLSVPYNEISPLFYADPAGAIIGRTTNSTKIWENKTIAGTSAVFATSLLTLNGNIEEKILSSFIITIIELVGGKIDNSLIAFFLIAKYLIQNT
jgi:dolichol kinase|tara:strand:+ start:205 stop:780 length:576 start_codon:yes stop_codon:yes gene_type:complete